MSTFLVICTLLSPTLFGLVMLLLLNTLEETPILRDIHPGIVGVCAMIAPIIALIVVDYQLKPSTIIYVSGAVLTWFGGLGIASEGALIQWPNTRWPVASLVVMIGGLATVPLYVIIENPALNFPAP